MATAKYLLTFCLFALVFGQKDSINPNCTQLVSEHEGSQHIFDIPWDLMPEWENDFKCNGEYCGNAKATFSCFTTPDLLPVNCTFAQEHGMFPLCAGRTFANALCTNFTCCTNLNARLNTFWANQWQSISMEINYRMLFIANSIPVPCVLYSSHETECTQYVQYYASSDWNACAKLQNDFDYFISDGNADDMAFALFH